MVRTTVRRTSVSKWSPVGGRSGFGWAWLSRECQGGGQTIEVYGGGIAVPVRINFQRDRVRHKCQAFEDGYERFTMTRQLFRDVDRDGEATVHWQKPEQVVGGHLDMHILGMSDGGVPTTDGAFPIRAIIPSIADRPLQRVRRRTNRLKNGGGNVRDDSGILALVAEWLGCRWLLISTTGAARRLFKYTNH